MTREHLFRGFHPDENGTTIITLNEKQIKGEWIEGDLLTDGIDYITAIRVHNANEHRESALIAVLPETIGEFTGLTDKNGKKIFEGDIIRLTPPKESNEIYVPTLRNPQEVRILKVVFFDGMFAVDMSKWLKYGHGKVALQAYETNRIEVIGNIFENPELLEDVE